MRSGAENKTRKVASRLPPFSLFLPQVTLSKNSATRRWKCTIVAATSGARPQNRPGAVQADVVEGAQRAILPARHHERLTVKVVSEEVARPLHQAGGADPLPCAVEDALLLQRQGGRMGVPGSGQSPGGLELLTWNVPI